MSFKDMLEADVRNVFLNTDEFSENHTLKYDGRCFEDISVLYIKVKERERPVKNAEGIFGIQAVLHVALSDIDGIVPEQGLKISIDDGQALGKKFFVKYKIATSSCSEGMVSLELEAYDE